MTNVIVCGGRNYADRDRVWAVLDEQHAREPITRLNHGGASGADRLAATWANARRVPCVAYPADWKAHGRGAGPRRNARMLAESGATSVIAFPGGRGTADMVDRALAAGLNVLEIR